MKFITQTELIKKDFGSLEKDLVQGLIKAGVYILAGDSKSGKSILCTTLCNKVAKGEDFLNRKTTQGKTIYFENDNYEHESKMRIIAQRFSDNDDCLFNFNDSTSIYDIFDSLINYPHINDVKLVIIDSLANISEFANSDESYFDRYEVIKQIADFAVKHRLTIILIHHFKKGDKNSGQNRIMGSKANSGATTGTILLMTPNEFSNKGKLSFIVRTAKDEIHIKKDEEGINWVYDDDANDDETIDPNALLLINYVVLSKTHSLSGTYQEIVAKTHITVNPRGMKSFLKRNINVFDENCISFNLRRTGQARYLDIIYNSDK